MARKNKELPDWDDGRTIADMNAEGMPWYRPEQNAFGISGRLKNRRRENGGMPEGMTPAEQKHSPDELLTREESLFFTAGALKAALLVAGVMSLTIVLLVLFCQFVWFR